MKDALGQEITEGFCAIVDPNRGSISGFHGYVIGTTKNKVQFIGHRWDRIPPEALKEMADKAKAGDKEIPVGTKVPTRVIMLKEPE